ncbi:hypothetical protein B0H67DRAFT_491356 [Lasiosphaeris hirsuta]|uniref:DUF7580 domain-containing protein n=1 Tax=Lasiosphaeris hirsuta TaxID=260670 RepID=A0AA40DPY9_9PEZI|nr:hypothetical protein B0H67DRAFT_491356 [Lasiosphaeris hirsuta]
MAEVVGLVLGGIPLAIWALGKFSEALDAFHGDQFEIKTFQTDLTLQFRRLELTLDRMGLPLGSNPSRRELEAAIKEKFSDMETVLTAKPLDKIRSDWRKVKRTFKRSRRRELIDGLRKWNGELDDLFQGRPEVPSTSVGKAAQGLIRRFDPKRCNVIRGQMSSFYRALSSGMGCICLQPHEVVIGLDWSVYEAESSMRIPMAISCGTNSPLPSPPPSRLSRTWVRSKASKIGVLFKPSPPSETTPPTPPEGKMQFFVPRLGEMEETRHVFHQTPSGYETPVSTLISGICSRIRHRYGIAAALCWSVLHLGGSPWVGEGWDTWQAKVFSATSAEDSGGPCLMSRYPYVSCLLPSPPPPPSTPADRRAGFDDVMRSLVFDLGVLLIELCLKSSFANLRAAYRAAQSGGCETIPGESRAWGVKGLVEEVRSEIGDNYGDAIERCVKFVFPMSETKRRFENPEFRRAFYETVVAPVQATYELILETASYLPE